jgi:CubicO group peptidase (beta-lactamase class C family)
MPKKMCIALALLLLVAPLSQAQDTSLAGKVKRYLQPFVQGNNFIGAVLIAQGDRILVSQAYGQANYSLHVANTPATRFHIASISKPFTAAAIVLLEERGLLRLDDPVSKYVPDFPEGQKISLRLLLTHTSGVPNVSDMPEYAAASRFHQTPRSLVEIFKNKPLDFPPGTKYAYSNSSYNLLAYVIEQVSHKPYGDFLRENIFVPLGLKDTGHDGDAAEVIPGAAAGYQPRGVARIGNAPYIDWSSKTGSASLYSTTADLLRFIRAYSEGEVIRKSTVDQLWTKRTGNNFGWFVRESHGELAVATNGRSPGFTSSAEYYPARRLAVIVQSNSYSLVSQSPIAEDLAAIALGKNVPVPQKIVAMKVAEAELSRIAGTYRFGDDFFRPAAQVRIRIVSGEAILDWGGDYFSALIPVGHGEFMDRQFWARVVMDPDASGFTYSMSGEEFKVKRVPGT